MAKKILIIESDVFLGDMLLQKLQEAGYEPTISHDGEEGFKKIKEIQPDMLLLDFILPSMNGYEILEQKQKDPDIKKIPVVIISNSDKPLEVDRILALGVKDYMIKEQFDPEEVLAKVREKLGDEIPSESKEKSKNTTGNYMSSLKDKKIMWVEDDSFLSDIIARKLSAEGSVLMHANDGEQALVLVEKETPDIMLLDIVLPGMSGFNFLEKARENPRLAHIPVIFLTNLSQTADVEKGKKLGASRFLVKATVTLDEIIDEIKSVIDGGPAK